jgi:hypothetical protein
MKVHVLQNAVADTLTGHYSPPPGTATETPVGGLPILDSISSAAPFVAGSSVVRVTPDQTSPNRTIWTGDSPSGDFPKLHENHPDKKLTSISGENRFVTAIAAVSSDASHSIVVNAKIGWAVNFDGTVDAGRYKKRKARTTSDANYKRVSASTGGQDAFLAGIETFEPRFSFGVRLLWSPGAQGIRNVSSRLEHSGCSWGLRSVVVASDDSSSRK